MLRKSTCSLWILGIVTLLLGYTVLVLLQALTQIRPDPVERPVGDPQTVERVDLSRYEPVLAGLAPVPRFKGHARDTFRSELRMACPNCRLPIPASSFKERAACGFCGLVPPPPPEDLDEDQDGMWDAWETRYGLDPEHPGDALLDPDGDRFNNREEFEAGSDPIDAAYSPVNTRLFLKRIHAAAFDLVFQGSAESADGAVTYILNQRTTQVTHFKRMGERVGGWELVGFEPAMSEEIHSGVALNVDRSALVVEREGSRLVLVKNKPTLLYRADLYFEPDAQAFDVAPGDSLFIRQHSLTVLDISGEKQVVYLQRATDGVLIQARAE